ncbi:hypothetical protein K502DRAFT_367084, partial [Neoconidiobolus thromboides FSU 785]
MKGRFSAIDIRASVQDIKESIIGLRLQNIYDINSKTFLLKFSQPDRKEFLIIESGIRLHLTQFSREKATTPSNFCTKLRKHLRTRRLTNVRQVGVDRIVEFEFASATGANTPGTYHLICEFYSSGNVILTDHEYTVISLLRVVKQNKSKEIEDKKDDKKGENKKDKKSNGKADNKKEVKSDEKENAFTMAVKNVYDISQLSRKFETAVIDKLLNKFQQMLENKQEKVEKGNKKGKGDSLKNILNEVYLFGLPLSEHVLLEVGLDPNLIIKKENIDLDKDSEFIQKLQSALQLADKIIVEFDTIPSKGYILLDDKSKKEEDDAMLYKEYHPFLFNQYKDVNYKEFPTFVTALDQFFSKIESQKLAQKEKSREDAAKMKLQAIKSEQMGRVDALAQAETQNRYVAELIENNLELVDQIILVLRSLLASGMDWQELEDMIRDETRKGNPLASHIKSLNLHYNQVTITLNDPYYEEDVDMEEVSDSEYESGDDDKENNSTEDKENKSDVKVDIDLGLSAHANASRYYTMKKNSATKKEKTLAIAETAFKNAEIKVQNDLKELKLNKPTIGVNKIRKPFWFEKFMWFISSEGYLVIAGRDVQQNELLVKKYLRKGDIYLHADMHGAATVIVKNPDQGTIPPSTLNQAGTMSVCHSKAWESKILTSAWWVFHHQVSKSAPTGEYLPAGSFMIRGKKNFLAPAALTYGFGLMYMLDVNSTARRLQARLKKQSEVNEVEDQKVDQEKIDKKQKEIDDKIEIKEETEQEIAQEDDDSVENEQELEEEKSSMKIGSSNLFNSNTAPLNENNQDKVVDKYGLVSSQHIQENQKSQDEAEEGKFEEDHLGRETVFDRLLNSNDANSNKEKGKKRISAKERKSMKKGGKINEESKGEEMDKKESLSSDKKSNKEKNTNQSSEMSSVKRGQRGKMKKIQNKYADQDEEEKEIRMQLLGSDKGPQPKGKKEKKIAEQKKQKEQMISERETYFKDKSNKKNEDEKNEDGAIKESEPAGVSTVNEEGDKNEMNEEIKAMLEEENIVILDEDETENLQVYMDGLVGTLQEGEIPEFMIPVSAPLSALNKLKFKVKLQPGTMKKGQAAKLATNHFLATSECTKLDQQLIKTIPNQEAINVLLPKSKVMAPSLAAAKKSANNKAAKKAAKKKEG